MTSTAMSSVALTQTGAYAVLVGDCTDTNTGNYNFSSQCFGTCPITPVITWATPSAITYRAALSATQLDAGANVAGAFVYSPVSSTVLEPGTQELSVTFTPTDTTDYNTATDSVDLTVNNPVPALTSISPPVPRSMEPSSP